MKQLVFSVIGRNRSSIAGFLEKLVIELRGKHFDDNDKGHDFDQDGNPVEFDYEYSQVDHGEASLAAYCASTDESEKKEKPLFLCFGAAGELCERILIRTYESKPNYAKIYGAPVANEEDKPKNYVKAPEGTTKIELELKDEVAGTHGSWPLEEVIPLNRAAVKVVARFIWEREKEEFKTWRKHYPRGSFSTLKALRRQISKLY